MKTDDPEVKDETPEEEDELAGLPPDDPAVRFAAAHAHLARE